MRNRNTRHRLSTQHSVQQTLTFLWLRRYPKSSCISSWNLRRCPHHRRTVCTAVERESFYSTLGVERDATLAEINSAYRQATVNCWLPTDEPEEAACRLQVNYFSRQDSLHHPARAVRLQAIKDAYEVLSDDSKRQVYNMYGIKGVAEQFSKDGSKQGKQAVTSSPVRLFGLNL